MKFLMVHFVLPTDRFIHGFMVSSLGFSCPDFIHFVFLGIISRAFTEQILSSKPVGSYLIRISEKIFGYVLSYHASDHCRHLLIEVTPDDHTYRFLGGAKKESFENLSQLIEKYSVRKINKKIFFNYCFFFVYLEYSDSIEFSRCSSLSMRSNRYRTSRLCGFIC
jgi:hypothetical protein